MTRKRTRLLSGLAAAVLISLLFAAPAPGQKDSDWRLIIARAGILIYQANSWGYVRTEVENPTDEEHELLMAVSFDAMEHNVQFTWPAWMPPRCRRTFWMPIRTPTFATPDRLLFTTKDTNGEEATETGPVRDLDQGTIPDDLRKAFAAYPKKDIALTPGATCQVLKEGASWLISDGYGGYAVVKERNELKIYLQVPGVDIKAQLLETVDGEHQKVESIGLLMVEPKRPTTAILNSRVIRGGAYLAACQVADSLLFGVELFSYFITYTTIRFAHAMLITFRANVADGQYNTRVAARCCHAV